MIHICVALALFLSKSVYQYLLFFGVFFYLLDNRCVRVTENRDFFSMLALKININMFNILIVFWDISIHLCDCHFCKTLGYYYILSSFSVYRHNAHDGIHCLQVMDASLDSINMIIHISDVWPRYIINKTESGTWRCWWKDNERHRERKMTAKGKRNYTLSDFKTVCKEHEECVSGWYKITLLVLSGQNQARFSPAYLLLDY